MKKKNTIVTHHNYINESRFENFTELELNLFVVILYKMRKEKDNEVVFKSEEIKGMTNSKERSYKTFEKLIHSLQDRTIYLKTKEGYDRVKPFPTLKFNQIAKEVTVEINKRMVPLIRELDQQFTQYSLKEFLSLNSKYGKRIFQMLKQYESIGKRTLLLSDLRDYLDCNNKSYDKMSNLDKKVLAKAKEDINENTSMKINYKKNKVGRSVKSVEFTITETHKDTYSDKIENTQIEEAIIVESVKDDHLENKKQAIDGKRSKLTIRKKVLNVKQKTHKDTYSDNKDTFSHKLEEALLKAKRNIYVSKAWNKRADNKVQKLVKDYGESYTVDILNRLYKGAKQDIKTTVVQYINGIMKNVQAESEDNKPKQKKIMELVAKEVLVSKAKEEPLLKNVYISIEEFKRLDDGKKNELEEKAIKLASEKENIAESFLLGLKSKSFSIYFNTINKYMERP